MLFYALLCGFSYMVAYELRFDFNVPDVHELDRINTIWWVVLLQLMMLGAAGQLDSILSYFRLPDALRLFAGLFVASLVMVSMWYVYGGQNVPPRSVILSDFLMAFLLIASFRVLLRLRSSRGLEDWLAGKADAENVLIVGAGEVGAGLCAELMNKSRLGMRPVAFLDDDEHKVGRYVHGLLVADQVNALGKVAKRYMATKVVIAFPSASIRRVREVAEKARDAGLTVDIVPALSDLVSGRAQMSQLRPVQLEDLLGRDPVDLNSEGIRSMIKGKRVLVTGAGGSIGRELVTQIIEYDPAELLCLDQAEIAVFHLRQDIIDPSNKPDLKVRTKVLDICNVAALEAVMSEFCPALVFHAAAHKHVNLMEPQPGEALRNNFMATDDFATLASKYHVERFILVSTDKAINPTSVMGVSKRLAELAVLEHQAAPGNQTRFMAVRFGNVLGSSGSVINIFRKQIDAGGPLTVTDPEVTRFFMTVEEAVGLVLQCATQGDGGEIFVLDMGDSVKIVDVARQMIALSGLREGEDIDIEFIGLKPGEKLYEEVQHLSEELKPTSHVRILRFVAPTLPAVPVSAIRSRLLGVLQENSDSNQIKRAIQEFVPEYSPHLD